MRPYDQTLRPSSAPDLFDRCRADLQESNHPSRLWVWARATAVKVYEGKLDRGKVWDDLLVAAICVGIDQSTAQMVIAAAFRDARKHMEGRTA
jgi:hypothetical protein